MLIRLVPAPAFACSHGYRSASDVLPRGRRGRQSSQRGLLRLQENPGKPTGAPEACLACDWAETRGETGGGRPSWGSPLNYPRATCRGTVLCSIVRLLCSRNTSPGGLGGRFASSHCATTTPY